MVGLGMAKFRKWVKKRWRATYFILVACLGIAGGIGALRTQDIGRPDQRTSYPYGMALVMLVFSSLGLIWLILAFFGDSKDVE